MTEPFKTYIQTLQADLARGNATEHTHRPALKTLIESLGERLTATNEKAGKRRASPHFRH